MSAARHQLRTDTLFFLGIPCLAARCAAVLGDARLGCLFERMTATDSTLHLCCCSHLCVRTRDDGCRVPCLLHCCGPRSALKGSTTLVSAGVAILRLPLGTLQLLHRSPQAVTSLNSFYSNLVLRPSTSDSSFNLDISVTQF